MVNIINKAVAVANLDENFHHFENIFLRQRTFTGQFLATNATVELHTTNRRQVVAVTGKEQVLEQVLGRILGRRLTWTHHAVDLDHRFQLGGGRVNTQGAGYIRTAIKIIHEQRFNGLDACFTQLFQQLLGHFFIGTGNQFAGFLIHDIM